MTEKFWEMLLQKDFSLHSHSNSNDPMCDPRESQEDEKNAISISIAFCFHVLIRNENITSEECETKNRLK